MTRDRRDVRNKPLMSRHVNRRFALRALIEAIKARKLTEYEILEEDEKVAEVLGPRRHAAMRRDAGRQGDTEESALREPLAHVRRQAIRHLRAADAASERGRDRCGDHLAGNVRRFARLVGLGAAETRVLDFLVRLEADSDLREIASEVGHGSMLRFIAALARIVGGRREEVYRALSPASRLVQSGVVEVADRSSMSVSRRRCDGLDDIHVLFGLCDSLVAPRFDFEQVFASFFRRCGNTELSLSQFSYLGDAVEVARALLAGAAASDQAGVQVLLHGAPGTGKTELAHALAKAIGKPLYAIASGSATGTPYSREERYRCFRLAQEVLRSRRGALVLFDEIEDVMLDTSSYRIVPQLQKGWTNEMLESNPMPSIWIANQTGHIDDAYLRRFTLIIHVDRPPRSVRRKICETYLKELPVDEQLLSRVADAETITPADLARTRRAMDMATSLRSEPETASRAVTTLLGSGPQAPGQATLLPKVNFKLPDFDPALINTTLALPALIDGLARGGEGRLCLYGPPGTGKTAFAAHVAERLDRDLITVSASSWLHPFLGMTERLMRDSFERAARTDSILFVDEADSFLRDRAAARHSWETTQVNELLKRLEEARGIVLFATNDFDALDPAVLRRLDVKAAFRPLGREQVRTMFERTLAVNDWREPRRELSAALAGLDSLDAVVNGDFTAACRHLHVTGQAMTPAALADALAREVGARERHQGQSIGFAAALE